jgi:phosphinothricin acetyltransferase
MTAPAALNVRHAVLTDMEAINAIYNHEIVHGTATWDTEPWTMAQRAAWWDEHSDPVQPVIVAEDASGVVGFAYLTLMSKKHGWRFTREDTIYVDDRARGKGVGSVLLQALLEEARGIGVRLVVASITSSNEVSIRLHERFGFEVVGVLRNAGYKFGEWMDTTYLQVDLGVASVE